LISNALITQEWQLIHSPLNEWERGILQKFVKKCEKGIRNV
jgi:hypothetical protein